MKALIWKEWRETIPVTLLGFLMLAASAAHTLFKLSTANDSMPYDGIHLDWLLFGAPCLALAIAAAQTLSERDRDLYAFLVHRPITRGQIASAKMLVGFAHYVAAAGIVYAASAWWASVPGHIAAPFDIRFSEAPVADIVGAGTFYFAGLLTFGKSTRLAIRILAIPVALAVEVLVTIVPEFWQALVIAIFALIIGSIAACGRFRTNGDCDSQRPIERFASVVVVLAGLCIPLSLTIWGAGKLLESQTHYRMSAQWSYSGYYLTDSGEFVTRHQSGRHMSTVTTVKGTVLSFDAAMRIRPPVTLATPFDGTDEFDAKFKGPPTYQSAGRWYARGPRFLGFRYWYWDSAKRIYVGYSMVTQRLIDTLTAAGFRYPDPTEPPASFLDQPVVNCYDGSMLRTRDGIYAVDDGNRTFTRLLAADLGGFRAVYSVGPSQDGPLAQPVVVVDTPSRTWFLSPSSRLFSIPCTAPTGCVLLDVAFIQRTSRFILDFGAKTSWPYIGRGETMPRYVVEVSRSGHVVRTYTLPPLPPSDTAGSWQSPPSLIGAFGAITPPLFVAIAGRRLVSEGDTANERSWLDWVYGSLWPVSYGARPLDRHYLVIALTSGVVCGITCALPVWLLATRRCLPLASCYAWLLPPLALGPIGAVLMAVMTNGVTTVSCTACRNPRSVTCRLCPRCGAEPAGAEHVPTSIVDSASERQEAMS